MAYDAIQPAAFVPNLDAGSFRIACHTLAFPAAWRGPILDFYKHGKPATRQAKIKQIPIKRLNAAIRTVAPDLITVETNASFDDTKPWLYSDATYPVPPLVNLVHAWLRDMQPDADTYQLFRDTVQQLDLHSLTWNHEEIDLLEHDISPGGTALPRERLYRLLPELLASRIAGLPPYEYCGDRISFTRVAVDARANGAELMSWPPLRYETKKGDQWHYSATIRVSLKTVPFSPIPRIHISTGIRRWVKGSVYIPRRSGASTYLLTTTSLVNKGAPPSRFAVATLEYDRNSRKVNWRHGGPEGLLSRASAIDNLPSPDVFVKEPETWLTGRDGITAGVSYHTRMGWHGVGAGLMPSERRRLTEWAAQALEPMFIRAPELRRSGIKQDNPKRALRKKESVPKKATEQEVAEIEARNRRVEKENSRERRALTASALPESMLTVFLLYQSDEMLDHIIAAAEHSLALDGYRTQSGPQLWTWEASDLSVHIHARRIGALASPLGDESTPRRSEELDTEISNRRSDVSKFLTALTDETSEIAQLVLVELEGSDAFKKRPTSDPKFAIRLGCADANMVSQFLRPRDPDVSDDKDDSAFRAAAAWNDGLRQTGVRFIPQHSLPGGTIPDQLNQIAFWMVKRQSTDQTSNKQFTPIAILIRPSQNCILGKSAGMDQWIPYPELLRSLTGVVSTKQTAEEQTAITATFIQNTLYSLRSQPALVVTHAQNTRYRWPWLQNSGLVADRVQLASGPLQRLALQGKQLRIVRIATGDRAETPQWWAPTDTGGGISKGLWKPSQIDDETNRIFDSTTEKSSTHSVAVEATKLTRRVTPAGKPEIKPAASAWNPELLEFTMIGLQPADNAEQWAMYLHQQRFCDDYRDGLGLPLIMHLAELTSHYALPHGNEDAPEADLPTDDEDTDPDESQAP